MKVYFIRHGQSEGNRQNRHCGWSDTPLSPLGHEQARAAGTHLRDIPFDRIYCSDLPRARQTAADALPGCEPVYSPKLREISVGTLAGRRIVDVAAQYGAPYWEHVRQQDFSAYGGETQPEMCRRLKSFFTEELERLTDCAHVAVFGHEGTVHQMMSHAVGHDVLLEHLQVDNASVTVFSYENGCWKLLKWNYTGAL
jgi:broad specificity phosphatase PhoE